MGGKARWISLDALRGIAALTVVAHHSLAVLPQFWAVYIGEPTTRLARIMAFSPLHLFWEGHQAVLVFFVLSGFVLSLPYWQGNSPGYSAFLIRRICRIYLPYLAALAIGAAALTAFSRFSLPEVRRWGGDLQPWGQPVTLAALVDHLLMLGDSSYNYINPVLWTLVIEMRLSILFPLLIWFMRRTGRFAVPLAFIFSAACRSVLQSDPDLPALLDSLAHTGTYLWFFILGAEAARSRALITAWSRRLPPVAQWLALALALLLLNARWEIGTGAVGTLAASLGAGVVVILCAYAERPARALEWPPLVALGRISYGLYLLHFLVLYTLLYERPAWLPLYAVLWLAPLLSLAAAAAFFRLVEFPAIRLGAALTRSPALAAPKIAGGGAGSIKDCPPRPLRRYRKRPARMDASMLTLSGRMSQLGTESAFEVLARAKALEAQGRSIINLGIGQPDFATPAHIVEAGRKALADGHHGYTPANGILPLREAVAADLHRRHGVSASPDQVLVVPGGKVTMFFAVMMFGEPGAEILYPNPGFPIYESVIRFSGATPVPMPLYEAAGFSFNADEVLAKITPKTRLIILNSPANPTGGAVPRKEFDTLVKGLERHPQVAVMSDEIYGEMVYDGAEHVSLLTYPSIRDRLILLDGWSKTYAMTGWRLGYGVWPKAIFPAAERLAINCHSCVNAAAQYAGIAALTGPREPSRQMVAAFAERRRMIIRALNALPGFRCAVPGGAFYAFPNITGTGFDSRTLQSRLLDETGVATISGTSFGALGEGYLRFSYAASLEALEEAMARIGAWLARQGNRS